MILIPHIIHYCWFGHNEMSKKTRQNIDDWKKNNPRFRFIEWNEENFDISSACNFVKDAYKAGEMAFVSDYVRLYAIYNYGGVYLDTDVKLIKPLENVINMFPNGYMGFEDENKINSGLGFGSPKGNEIIKKMINYYNRLTFNLSKMDSQACPVINSLVLKNEGIILNNKIQQVNGFKILPTDFLCPKSVYEGSFNLTNNTISIHEYNASWMNRRKKYWMYFIFTVKRILPKKLVVFLRRGCGNKYDKSTKP